MRIRSDTISREVTDGEDLPREEAGTDEEADP
jgi:hypothetical protein